MQIMWIIIISLLFITLSILLFVSLRRTKESIVEKFYNDTTNLKKLGGLLVNNFGMEYFQKMLNVGDVNFSDTSVCASINRKTCTAYSYLRNDLIPMMFMFPGVTANVPCGIILDPVKAWPLITLMSVIDADTNNRSCCTNENYTPIIVRNPFPKEVYPYFNSDNANNCITRTLEAQGKADWAKGNFVVYMPLKDRNLGAGCPTSCDGDLHCMYNNTGGNINQYIMNASPDCLAGKYKDSFIFTQVDESTVPDFVKEFFAKPESKPAGYIEMSFQKDCPDCKKPFLCVFDTSAANKYETNNESDRIASYIGKDGLGFKELFTKYMDAGYLQILQCRFEKKDWNMWIKVVKDWYKSLLAIMDKNNSMPDAFSYMLANPNSQSYFENEINLYINPDTRSDEYKQQNAIFQDAIIGFYYNGLTCEEQLSELNGVKSISAGNPGDVFYNGVDRCDRYWWMNDRNLVGSNRRAWEIDTIRTSKEMVQKVAKMFNEKHGRKVPVFKNVGDSNAFPSYKSMKRALNGDVRFSDVFVLDD